MLPLRYASRGKEVELWLKGKKMTVCKTCNSKVIWVKEGKRLFCRNPDGSDHWDLCSKLKWDQVKATGTRFESKRKSGYKDSIHGTKFDMLAAHVAVGKDYKPDGCTCGLPPWELCKPDCEHGIGRTMEE